MQQPSTATRIGAIISIVGGLLIVFGSSLLPFSFAAHDETTTLMPLPNLDAFYGLLLFISLIIISASVAELVWLSSRGLHLWMAIAGLVILLLSGWLVSSFANPCFTGGCGGSRGIFFFGGGYWLPLVGFLLSIGSAFIGRKD